MNCTWTVPLNYSANEWESESLRMIRRDVTHVSIDLPSCGSILTHHHYQWGGEGWGEGGEGGGVG